MLTAADEQELATTLGNFKRVHARVSAVVVASPDGRGISDPDMTFQTKLQLTGMSAATMAILRKGFKDNALGGLSHARVSGETGTILLCPVGPKAVVCVVVEGRDQLDSIIDAAQQLARRLDAAF